MAGNWGNVQQGLVSGYQVGRSTGGGRLGTLGANIKMLADEFRRKDLENQEINNKIISVVATEGIKRQLDPTLKLKEEFYKKAAKGEGAKIKGISAEGNPIIDIPTTQETLKEDLLNRWSQGEPLNIEQKRLIGVAVSPMEALMDATMSGNTPAPEKPKPKVNIPKQTTGVSQNKVMVISPNGQKGYIPSDQLQDALSQGYKRSL